jgi:membrane protein implicated in regulation of membrane protease activity
MNNKITNKPSKKNLNALIIGTILILLCCFTPLLVFTLSLVGLSFFTPYLDFVLFPALLLFTFLTMWSYKKYKKKCRICDNDTSHKTNS